MTTDPRITVAQDLTATGPQACTFGSVGDYRGEVAPGATEVANGRQIGAQGIEGGK